MTTAIRESTVILINRHEKLFSTGKAVAILHPVAYIGAYPVEIGREYGWGVCYSV